MKKNYLLTGIYILVVLFMANLNALVDLVQHPVQVSRYAAARPTIFHATVNSLPL